MIFVIVIVSLVGIQAARAKEQVEKYELAKYEETGKKIISRERKHEDDAQYYYYLSHMISGLNSSQVKLTNGKYMLADICEYYDVDMNSIMQYNTLLLVQRNSEDKGPKYSYRAYKNKEFADQINRIIENTYQNSGEIVLSIDDIYVKENEFVPKQVSYTVNESDGSVTATGEISVEHGDDAAMEKNGYKLIEMDFTSVVGHITNEADEFIIYSADIPSDLKDRIDVLKNSAIEAAKGTDRGVVKNDVGLFGVEFLSYNTVNNEGDIYHIINYQYRNVLLNISPFIENSSKMPLIVVVFMEAFALFLLMIIVTAVYIKKSAKN